MQASSKKRIRKLMRKSSTCGRRGTGITGPPGVLISAASCGLAISIAGNALGSVVVVVVSM
jgi:hypothetical protein